MRCLGALLITLVSANVFAEAPLSTILFGSCSHQDKPLPILNSVIADSPDLFIFLGDNVYGDTEDMDELKQKYKKLGNKAEFQALKKTTQTVAIWDDHDFGENDVGADYPEKESSRQIMLDFWGEPQDSLRRTRPDGIYTAYMFGPEGKRIQVILPDLRWNRPEINHVSKLEYLTSRRPDNMGPYKKHGDATASMLGDKQWKWLEEELQKPAEIRIIGSSLQVLADFTGWEAWANFPADLERLQSVIKQQQVNGVLLISGDTHWGEISKLEAGLDYPLWDVTSSGLTEEWKDVSPNKNRVSGYTHKVNYGAIDVDWDSDDPTIQMRLQDINGEVIMHVDTVLSAISPYPKDK